MLFTGIDLHRRDLVMATIDGTGARVTGRRLPTTREAVATYFAQFPSDTPHEAVVETTTTWYWLADLCRTLPVTLHLAHAGGVKAISAAKVKTDAVDADTLAQLLRTDLIPEAHMIQPAMRELRQLLRMREACVRRRTRCRLACQTLLAQHNVVAVSLLPTHTRTVAELQQEQAALLQRQIAQLECLLRPQLVRTATVQRLLTVPGIGLRTAYTIQLEVETMERFPDFRAFASYARLVPGAANSGGKVRHKRSRAGNRYLKACFSHAAVRAIQYYPEIRAWYLRHLRRKGKPIALALVAKELARLAYVVWTKGEAFNGSFKGVHVTRQKHRLT